MMFEAQKNSGFLELKDSNGVLHKLAISVLDYPMWIDYQEIVKDAKNQKASIKGRTDSDKADIGEIEMSALLDQLKMLVPQIEAEMLRGFPLAQLAGMLEYCVGKASVSEDRTPDEKKTVSAKRSKSSPSRAKASRSRR